MSDKGQKQRKRRPPVRGLVGYGLVSKYYSGRARLAAMGSFAFPVWDRKEDAEAYLAKEDFRTNIKLRVAKVIVQVID